MDNSLLYFHSTVIFLMAFTYERMCALRFGRFSLEFSQHLQKAFNLLSLPVSLRLFMRLHVVCLDSNCSPLVALRPAPPGAPKSRQATCVGGTWLDAALWALAHPLLAVILLPFHLKHPVAMRCRCGWSGCCGRHSSQGGCYSCFCCWNGRHCHRHIHT